ncbi:ABC transporter substrate-binding protein [Rhodococcus sp. ACPA4]|nr:ABC transporter substrate-binding protein [Rhodococcus globerulus]NRI66373.1 ABC transporter substrate-binding protein [Rhodococcus sp. MS16]PBC44307.1 ABC transporter substrate-binding protein [Rhodococcus sp. ACPA4]PSR43545.1 ABC transporter substrate-binding protein [Rhodococcus sp. AD45-ID]ROZ50877.1 ABC transporter substrate-binding protein [Rhodococcus sp. WS3]RZL24308.1 MAG: ABC transporter substrate-binding protein [Rhodococcus sp. (in: high G+C Gram-positive bacteria)]
MHLVRLLLVGVIVALCGGCVVNDEGLVPEGPPLTVQKVPEIAALLPPKVAETGKLQIGVNIPYAPNEFKDADGNIVGFDVDLMKAVAAVLGVEAVFNQADFDKIIPAIQSGSYDMGMSSFTDSKEREKTVDFVTYYSAGIQWAQRPDNPVDPNNACGLRVAVQTTTTEDIDEVPAKSEACVAAGKPPIEKVKYDSQDDAANALILGRVDALSADSPVTGYAIKRSKGRMEAAGEPFDSAPYGWPIVKGSELGPALQQAMQYLIDNGVYQQIAQTWSVEAGVIEVSKINGAES